MYKLIWFDEINRRNLPGFQIPNRITIITLSNNMAFISKENNYIGLCNEIINNEKHLLEKFMSKGEGLIRSIYSDHSNDCHLFFQNITTMRMIVAVAKHMGIDVESAKYYNMEKKLGGYQVDCRTPAKVYNKRVEKLGENFRKMNNPEDFLIDTEMIHSYMFGMPPDIKKDTEESTGEVQETETSTVEIEDSSITEDTGSAKAKFSREPLKFVMFTPTKTLHKIGSKCACRLDKAKTKEVDMNNDLDIGEVKVCGRCLRGFIFDGFDTSDIESQETEEIEVETPEEVKKSGVVSVGDYGLIAKQLVDICNKYKICGTMTGSTMRVVTASGSWYFNYVTRPIKLYHLNYDTKGTSSANFEYHKQSVLLDSPLDALVYIIKHDNARIERLLAEALNKK